MNRFFFCLLFVFSCFKMHAQSGSYSSNYKTLQVGYHRLLGIKVKNVIEQLHLDSSQITAIEEPPLVLVGISFDMGDSLEVKCSVERTALFSKTKLPYRLQYQFIEDKKVKEILIFDKRTHKYYHLK
jgi:hypothetical protein